MKLSAKAVNILLLGMLPSISGSICTGADASPNWYGTAAFPPYFIRDDPENCTQKYSLSRCEQSAVMKDGTSNFTTDDSGAKACKPNVDCFPTKQNCNDTIICSDLIKLKEELMGGGHNIVCRHEKTYWQQNTGEVKNCHYNGNCLDSEVKATQRQLQPEGWRSANAFATAFREMDIPIGKTFSSPFTRCAEHANLFSDKPNEERLELLYMGGYLEVLALNNITEIIKLNALKWQAYNIRNFAGKKPAPGKNNIMVTHGFNIKLGFGTAVDEGYCMVLRPEDSEPSLADSIGSVTVANQVFEFDNDAFPVNAIARMSPESALLMQTCDEVRSDAIDDQNDVLAAIDTDHDMKITKEEFTAADEKSIYSRDAFDFISSVFIQPEILGKPKSNDKLPSIEIGQFFHINWGWREYLTTGGDISYPWRAILENTIGSIGHSTSEQRVAAFKHANAILPNLITVLKDKAKYPTMAEMEEKLINCDTNAMEVQHINNCSDLAFLAESGGSSYIPLGPGDNGAGVLGDGTIFGTPLAYPSIWKSSTDFYESRSLKVANCLVAQGSLSLFDISNSLGCDAPPTKYYKYLRKNLA